MRLFSFLYWEFAKSTTILVQYLGINILFFRLKIGDMGSQQAEPRLELKKHRRQSRKKTNQSILDGLDDDDNLLDEESDPLLNALKNENP